MAFSKKSIIDNPSAKREPRYEPKGSVDKDEIETSLSRPSRFIEKMSQAAGKSEEQIIFKRLMKHESVKIEFFILEGILGFDELHSEKNVVVRSEDRLQEDYYTKAIEGNFNKPWSEFKSFVLDYCTKQSL